MKPRYAAIAAAVAFFGACFTFPNFGVAAHSPFLFGIGGLSTDLVQSMDFVSVFIPFFSNEIDSNTDFVLAYTC